MLTLDDSEHAIQIEARRSEQAQKYLARLKRRLWHEAKEHYSFRDRKMAGINQVAIVAIKCRDDSLFSGAIREHSIVRRSWHYLDYGHDIKAVLTPERDAGGGHTLVRQ